MLEIKHLRKSFKETIALDDVSLCLKEGIYALLGPNGAGKSTLMRILCNQCLADEGSISYQGNDIIKSSNVYYRHLGYAPQQQGLYDDFSGLRFLSYMALLKDLPKEQLQAEVLRVAEKVNMKEHLHKKCRTYSGGMKQRMLVAAALLGSPHVLLFDEPTAGLDPKERVSLRNVFEQLKKEHILLIATHVVSDIEQIADEIIFLKKGRVIDQGSLQELQLAYGQQRTLEELYLSIFDEDAS